MIDNGADVNAKDNDGGTPLHWRRIENAAEIAKLLLANGAEVNAKNNVMAAGRLCIRRRLKRAAGCETAACQRCGGQCERQALAGRLCIRWRIGNAADVAKLLLANGAEVNARNTTAGTPLHFGGAENAAEVAKLLIDNGADVNAKDNQSVRMPLHFLRRLRNNAVETLRNC